jgi:hypothetical protein
MNEVILVVKCQIISIFYRCFRYQILIFNILYILKEGFSSTAVAMVKEEGVDELVENLRGGSGLLGCFRRCGWFR